jgi:hypothetical protein
MVIIHVVQVRNPKRWSILKAGWLGYYKDETAAAKHQLMVQLTWVC